MTTLRQQLLDLIDKLSPEMERLFNEAVARIKSDTVVARVIEALEQRDVESAIAALHIEAEAFSPLKEALRQAFNAGGTLTVGQMPRLFDQTGARVILRWDASNQRAEAKISASAAEMVTGIVETTKEAVRQTILAGYEQGKGPQAIGVDIVGRISRATDSREGGMLGATHVQAGYVNEARAILSDPARLREFVIKDATTGEWKLRWTAAGKPALRTVLKAIREGKALTREQVKKITDDMTNRYVKKRGEMIGRTETLMAVTAAKHEAYLQALNKAGRDESLVTRRWRAVGDRRTRHSHMILNGQTVQGMDTPFQASNGDLMRYPGDRELGAGASSVVNCFAPWTRISPAGLVAAVAHEYSGDLIELSVGGDVYLSVTPNHPILTHRGWVPAGHIVEGDKLVHRTVTDLVSGSVEPEVANADPRADQLYDAAKAMGRSVRTSRSVVNFHGHVPGHDVDIVFLPSELRDALNPALCKAFGDIDLPQSDISKGRLMYDRLICTGSRSDTFAANNFMSLRRTISTFFGRLKRGASGVPGRDGGQSVTQVLEARVDDTARTADGARYGQHGIAFVVKLFDAIKVLLATVSVPTSAHFAYDCGNVTLATQRQAKVGHATSDNSVGNAERGRDAMDGMSFIVEGGYPSEVFGTAVSTDLNGSKWHFTSVPVSHVRKVPYVGLVYDFQTENGLIIAQNNIAHNCRCDCAYSFSFAEAYARSRGR